MTLDGGLLDTLAELRRTWDEVEVFYKKGRSRTLSYGPQNVVTTQRQEEGWAVRVGDRRRSFQYAATGSPQPNTSWPEADGHGLRLPSARLIPRWALPSSFDAPLVGESEALGLFEGLARELEHELPGARLLSGHLDDGSSESQLLSSREVVSTLRHRTAVLQVEAAAPGRVPRSVSLVLAERDARRFSPAAVARRLADHLAVITRGAAPVRDRGEFLLAPPVAIAILDSLAALWVGPGAGEYIASLVDRRDRIGSTAFTLIDDGRFPGGLLEAPTDGEGQPTREVVLVEEGVFRQPLLSWWQAPASPKSASGCSLRPGWRLLPRPGPTHLYLKPNPAIGVANLLAGLRRGYYLLAAEGAPRLDLETFRFALPVSGYSIDSGRPVGSVTGAWLVGSVSSFLNGLLQTARDLTFQMQGGGLVGAPTLHVRGLELRQSP